MEEESKNWSESVEDLIDGGDIDKAISLLESLVSNLQTLVDGDDGDDGDGDGDSNLQQQLSSALFDLSKLYHSKGFSLKADHAHSQSLLFRDRNLRVGKKDSEQDGVAQSRSSPHRGSSDDDWEAIVDAAPNELLSPEYLPEVSKLSLDEVKVQTAKRRGRGTFSYRKHSLYSDQQSDGSIVDDSGNEDVGQSSEGPSEVKTSKYGTRHVLVLADFPPSTRTTDLEKLLENFKGRGLVIRWVNDTTALAVFRTPADAIKASNSIHCPFSVRVLDENDILLSSIPSRDLEPPRRRPETSTSTAKRLIAHGMGIKLPSSSFGSKESRKQEEEARRSRIISRQNMRDDAWGDDIN